jgi:hypothetical protein
MGAFGLKALSGALNCKVFSLMGSNSAYGGTGTLGLNEEEIAGFTFWML